MIDCMKGMLNVLDPRKELFELINFDGTKVVQVEGDLLEVDRKNLTCMLRILHGEKMLQVHRKSGVCEQSHQGIQSGTSSVRQKIPSLLQISPKYCL